MLNMFSCDCWPSVCCLWKNVYSGPLPVLKLDFFFFFATVWVLYIFWILTPFQIYDLQIFLSVQQVAFSFCEWFLLLCSCSAAFNLPRPFWHAPLPACFLMCPTGTRITVTPTPKDQMRIEGLEEVRVFCGPLSFMSTKRIGIEARSIPPVTSWPPALHQVLCLLLPQANGREAVPRSPRPAPVRESWHAWPQRGRWPDWPRALASIRASSQGFPCI